MYTNKPTKAINDFTTAIALNPSYSNAYNHRGSIYKDMHKYPKAIFDFDKAIASDPKNSAAYGNRGITYMVLKKYQKASENFQMFLKLEPNHPLASKFLFALRNLKRNNLTK